MKDTRVIELLRIERECVRRGLSCDRECGNCELTQDTDELLEMYGTAIELISAYHQRMEYEEDRII